MKRWIVGLDGDHTPDPMYWRWRWLCIEATSEEEAKKLYREKQARWLKECEAPYLFADQIEAAPPEGEYDLHRHKPEMFQRATQ